MGVSEVRDEAGDDDDKGLGLGDTNEERGFGGGRVMEWWAETESGGRIWERKVDSRGEGGLWDFALDECVLVSVFY